MRIFYRIVWIMALLSIIGMSCVFLIQPTKPPVVAPMIAYVSDDKSIALQYPGNWKPRTGSSQAVSSRIVFDPNSNTHFAVDTDLIGSLIGDMAKSSNAELSALQGMPGMPAAVGGGSSEKQKSPLEIVHEAALHAMSKSRSRYPDFEQGPTKSIQLGGMEALSTEFTYQGGSLWEKREMVGTYITMLDKEREVTVTATCSKELQKTMQPLFDQMIASIRFGQTGG